MGNKILAAALGCVCRILLNLCAPKVVTKDMGRKMTDLFEEEIRNCEHRHGH